VVIDCTFPRASCLQQRKGSASIRLQGTCPGVQDNCLVSATLRNGKRILPGWRRRKVGLVRNESCELFINNIPVGGPYRLGIVCGRDRLILPSLHVGDCWLLLGGANLLDHASQRNSGDVDILKTWRSGTGSRSRSINVGGLADSFAEFIVQQRDCPQSAHTLVRHATLEDWLANPVAIEQLVAASGGIAGLIWYHGEDDAIRGYDQDYGERLRMLMTRIRLACKDPHLPVIIVQLGRAIGIATKVVQSWNSIQDQQLATARSLPNCDLVSTVDLDLAGAYRVHPAAYAALAHRIGRSLVAIESNGSHQPCPLPMEAQSLPWSPGQGPRIAVRFSHVDGRLRAIGQARGFTLLGPDDTPHDLIYHVELQGSTAILHTLDHSPIELRVAYGAGCNPYCSLMDGDGRAIPAFGPMPVKVSPLQPPRRTTPSKQAGEGTETTGRWRRTPDGVLPVVGARS
jgi:hypothetical protein